MHILYVEDDPTSRDSIARMLRAANHRVAVFSNSMEAIGYLDRNEPDVVLTDYRLGNFPDGLMFAEHVRQRYLHCVIILISQFADFDEAVKAMHLNADDFIKKPISGHDLIERIYQAVMRRSAWLPRKSEPTVEIPNLKLDRTKHTVEWYGKVVVLTPAEFQIISTLISKPGNIFSFTSLAAVISKKQISSPDQARVMLKTHVKNLRQKLSQGSTVDHIQSIRGKGFKWQLSQSEIEDSSPIFAK